MSKSWRRGFTIPGLPDYFTPRFHAGVIANFAGRTSYVYAGALWTYNFTQRWFIEGFFGGLIHNGHLDDISDNMNGLGCRWAFHSGGSIGYRVNERWSVMRHVRPSLQRRALSSKQGHQRLRPAAPPIVLSDRYAPRRKRPASQTT